MIVTPTTTVTILGTPGGDGTDEYGDPVEDQAEALTGIPAAIHAGREVVATESDPEARVVRYFTARLPHGTPVTGAQRLRDERTGDVYLVDNVTVPQHPALPQDVRLDLRRVT